MPPAIRASIEERVDAIGFAAVKRAATMLSGAYREGAAASQIPAGERVTAYLVTRMPATYAAARAVLEQTVPLLAARAVETVLDIGAGTGAASIAAREFFPGARFTLVERDAAMLQAAREWLPDAVFVAQDAARMELPPHDVVLASYSLGEMGARFATRLWKAARVALVILEPGTKKGFGVVREIRANLLAAGGHMLAPCPAAGECPMIDPDWCHFAARVERSSLHRRMKDAELGYEDEKFSYVALAREPAILPSARIVRHPQHQPGVITLETCTPSGLGTARVTKRDRELFRRARRAGWGDAW